MRVLYVNHTAEVSGGEWSLLSLIEGLPESVRPVVAAPAGQLTQILQERHIPVRSITGTAGSLRLSPLHTPRALIEMARAGRQLRRVANRDHIEVVHANSIRAAIMVGLARVPRTARIAHVRDCLPRSAASTATLRLIAATATTIVANSAYTARSVRAAAPQASIEVVHNPVDLARWDPTRIDRAQARARLGRAGERRMLLGVVAQLSPWKGQDTAIEALRLACEEGVDAHLLLIGSAKFLERSTRFDNRGYVEGLRAMVAAAGLVDRVTWLGEREDVPELVRALDALLLPSREEPFGRAVIEAMALGVPVLATNVGGPVEIIEDGREGYLLSPADPAVWARTIRRIAESPELGAELGQAGRRRVEQAFTVEHHVARMLDVYARAIDTMSDET